MRKGSHQNYFRATLSPEQMEYITKTLSPSQRAEAMLDIIQEINYFTKKK